MDIVFNASFFISGTVVVTGNSGVIATPNLPVPTPRDSADVMVPLYFYASGTDMATDEVNTLTIDWFATIAGLWSIGTTTFAQMTAGAPIPPVEFWPGDVDSFTIDYTSATGVASIRNFAPGGYVPAPPFCKITHTLGGTTKSMSYGINMAYLLV